MVLCHGNKMVTKEWRFLKTKQTSKEKTLKLELPNGTAIPLRDKYSKVFKQIYHRNACIYMLIAELVTIAKK